MTVILHQARYCDIELEMQPYINHYCNNEVEVCVDSTAGPSSSSDAFEVPSELEPSPAIMISPMSAFNGTRSSIGRGAGRAGDRVKRSSNVRD